VARGRVVARVAAHLDMPEHRARAAWHTAPERRDHPAVSDPHSLPWLVVSDPRRQVLVRRTAPGPVARGRVRAVPALPVRDGRVRASATVVLARPVPTVVPDRGHRAATPDRDPTVVGATASRDRPVPARSCRANVSPGRVAALRADVHSRPGRDDAGRGSRPAP
jgi:hypothetical protein